MLSVLRIVTGLLFMQHGAQKLLGMFANPDNPRPAPEMWSQSWWAGVLELYGGGLFLLGLLTRPVAFLLSGMMAVAYFQSHAPHGPIPILNRGELAALYCFVFLYFVFAGAGPLSLDAALFGGRRRVTVVESEP